MNKVPGEPVVLHAHELLHTQDTAMDSVFDAAAAMAPKERTIATAWARCPLVLVDRAMETGTRAFEVPPVTASNRDAPIEHHVLERLAFAGHVDLARFHALRDVVLELRHRTIAHADGSAFSVHHDDGFVRSLAPVLTPELYAELRDACAKLLLAVLRMAGGFSDAP